MDKNKKATEDDLKEKDVIIGAEEADDEIEDDIEDDSGEEEIEEEIEEESPKKPESQKPKLTKSSKPQKEPKKKAKKKQEEYEEEYEDEDEYDDDEYEDDDEGGGKTKIIIIAVVIAAAVAAAGIFMYNKITKDNEAEQQRQEQIEQQTQADEAQKKIQEANEAEAKKNAEENTDEEEEETPTPTEEPVATSTPKPLPTATPTATPFPEETTDDTYYTPDDNDGVVDVSNEGTTGGISNGTEDTQPEVTQAPAGVIFVGDSRFRAMANIATDNSDLWECSSTGDYNWLTGTAFTDVDPRVGKGTKVFISIGINDLTQYQSYASAIVAKAQEWNAKGATVYFVSVGPVGSDSYILNQDIVNYNTYLYQSFANAGVYYIDAYNYLVQSGYDTTDGENYTDATSMALYSYINSLIGR